MPEIALNGELLHYREQGEGPPVLLLHSLGLDSSVWAPQMDALASHFRAIALDARAHGLSSGRRDKSVRSMVDDVAAFLGALGLSRVRLVGCSMGGVVAQLLTINRPELVERLLLTNTFASMDPAEAAARVAKRRSAVADGAPGPTPEERAASVLRPDAPDCSFRLFAEAAARIDGETLAAVSREIYSVDTRAELRSISCPVLVVAGSEDDRTPVSMVEELRNGIPGAALEVLQGAGHIAHLDRPDEFNSLMLAFLSEAGTGPLPNGRPAP